MRVVISESGEYELQILFRSIKKGAVTSETHLLQVLCNIAFFGSPGMNVHTHTHTHQTHSYSLCAHNPGECHRRIADAAN